MKTASQKINEALKALRKDGYFAARNHACCQSCGFAEIPGGVKNIIFAHMQDEERFASDGSMYFSHSGDVGKAVEKFKLAGLQVEWDGTVGQRILVY